MKIVFLIRRYRHTSGVIPKQDRIRRRVEGLAYQVLIHTYDAVLLFDGLTQRGLLKSMRSALVDQVMVFERYRIKRPSAQGGCLGGNRR